MSGHEVRNDHDFRIMVKKYLGKKESEYRIALRVINNRKGPERGGLSPVNRLSQKREGFQSERYGSGSMRNSPHGHDHGTFPPRRTE